MVKYPDAQNKREDVATEQWKHIAVALKLKKIPNISKVRITYSGKDAEYWQGHYGASFANESIRVKHRSKDGLLGGRSLVSRMKYRRSYTGFPFGTFFNDGMGELVFFDGVPIGQKQNNIADFDLTVTYIFQHKTVCEKTSILKSLLKDNETLVKEATAKVDYSKAFNGNSCYSISWDTESGSEVLIHKLFKTDIQVNNEEVTIYSAIYSQDLFKNNVHWLIKLASGDYVRLEAKIVEERNKWLVAKSTLVNMKDTIKGIYLLVKAPKANAKHEISLGHFAMGVAKSHWLEPSTGSGKITKLTTIVNPKTLLAAEDRTIVDLQAKWECDANTSLVHCYRVYL